MSINNIIKLNVVDFQISIVKEDQKYWLMIFNKNYLCLLLLKSNNANNTTKICIVNKMLIFKNIYTGDNACYIGLKLEKFIEQFSICNFTKIKFSGKGYKIKKNSANSFKLLFNRSHITGIWWRNIFIKKYKKYKIYVSNLYMDGYILNKIINLRPINVFTKKGLRKSRQIYLKKKGKK